MPAQVDPLAEARALRPLVEAEAEATDRELLLTRPVLDALEKSGLNHLMVPREFGGQEADTDTILDVFEELAHQDGSIGWTHMATAAATAYVSYLDPALAAQMVRNKPASVCAGQFAPRGRVARENGGFRVSGNFSFGSGSGHASFVGGAGFLMREDGSPELLDSGMPAYLCFFTPKDRVELQGGWDVMGLRGTGSFDYEVPDQHVDAASTFYLFEATPRSGGHLYGLGPTALAGLGHAGWGLGVARRALDEVTALATRGRARLGAAPLRDQQVFQRELGEKLLALQSVRLLVHDAFGRAIRRLESGNPVDKPTSDEMMASVAYLTQVAEEATEFAYRLSGSDGLRNPSQVQRCFRDMFTGGLHVFVDRRSYDELAKSRLGIQ